MIKYLIIFGLSFSAWSQSFAPEPGTSGSTAIYKDSSVIQAWATGVVLQRGWLDIQDKSLGLASYGMETDAVGVADGSSVVSLGDSGIVTLTFDFVISNGPGPDFAVFENGFTDHYMEFAFVEVSSDGINFVRFPATSETPTSSQLSNFSYSDCRYVNNLAGKYRVNYGTPFDLEELIGETGLDLNAITHVRLIDVIGSIDSSVGSQDQYGTMINDPYPTTFESGGFDLDGVAVLNGTLKLEELPLKKLRVYPNPATEQINLDGIGGDFQFGLTDLSGKLILSGTNVTAIDLTEINAGIYILTVQQDNQKRAIRITKY